MLARKRPRPTRLSVEPLEERRLLAVMSFQDGVLPTPDYAGTRDVPLFGAEEDVNFGDEVTLRADAEQGSTGFPIWSLVKWDLSGIPATATINDVSIVVNVTNTTVAPGFNLLAMRTPWIESEATWNGPTINSTWEEPGVTDPSDFDPTVLGTMTGTATGPLSVLFNSAGRAVVAGWLADPASNHGLLISNAANDNSLRFDSREGTTATNRPKLSIDFTFNDVDPPTATLIDPLDNGPADQDDDEGEVRVGVRDSFVIQLDDFALNDTTVTAETLTISKDAAAFGEFTFAFDAAADQITLTPTAGSFAEGSYTITLSGGAAKIADDSGSAMPSTVLAIVIDAGLPTTPVAEDDAYETAEDTPLVADPEAGVLDNDFGGNAPGDAVLVTGPSNGTLELNPDGSFTYTPADDFTGQDSFTYILETPLFTSSVATATIDVLGQSPVTNTDKYNGLEDELLTVDAASGVLANDVDPQGDEMTAVLSRDVREGTLTLNPDGSFTYQPNENFVGPDSFRYRASDGEHESASTLVQITVENVNDRPVAVDDFYTAAQDTPFRTDQPYLDTVLADGPIAYWRFDESTGTVAEDISGSGFHGTYVGNVSLSEPGALTNDPNAAVRLHQDNDRIIIPREALHGRSNVSVEFWLNTIGMTQHSIVSGARQSNDNAFHIAVEPGRETVYFHNSTNALQWAAPSITQEGWHHFVFLRDDTNNMVEVYVDGQSLGRRSDAMTTLSIDPGGLIVGQEQDRVGGGFDSRQSLDGILDELAFYDRVLSKEEIEDHFYGPPVNVVTNDLDVDGDALESLLVNDVRNGTLVLQSDGSFTYTPDDGFIGVDTFTYVATDGQVTSNVATATIKVNAPPVATDDEYAVDANASLFVETAIGLLTNDSDANEDPLSALLVSGPSSGMLDLTSDGSFTYTPQADFIGTDTFTYRADDGHAQSVPATVTINVVGQSPVARSNKYNALEDELLIVDAASGVLANDSDPQGDEMTAVLVRDVREGTLTLNPDGSFTYQPNENFVGPDSFRYRASDGEHQSASTLVQITIENVNDPPVAVDDSYDTFADTTLFIHETVRILPYGSDDYRYLIVPFRSGSADFADPSFDDSSFNTGNAPFGSGCGGPLPQRTPWPLRSDLLVRREFDLPSSATALQVSVAVDNDVRVFINGQDISGWRERASCAGSDNFIFDVPPNLLLPGEQNLLAVLARDEGGANYFDVELRATLSTPSDILVVPAARGVAANDLDVDDNTFEVVLVDDVQHGTLTLADDGSFRYEPSDGFAGFDTFTYVASDGQAASNVATVTIRVNAAPVVEDDVYDVAEDDVLVVDVAAGVLSNDTDPNDDAMTAVLVSGPDHGSVELADDGSFTYTPQADFFGDDSFTYHASDGHSTSEETTVFIAVDSINDAPLVADDLYVIQEETLHTIVGHVNDGSINKFGSTNIQADATVTVSRVGRSGLPRANRVAVYFFELPDLSPSETIDASNLSFNYVARDDDGLFGPPPFSVDLYGLGWVSGPPQLNVDWFWESRDDDARTGDELGTNIGDDSVTKLQDNIITNPRAGAPVGTPVGRVETDGSGDGELTDFLRSLYEQGASGGDFAVLRLSHDIQIITGNLNGYRVSLADDLGNEPVLSIQTRRDLNSPLGGVLIVAAPTGVLHNDRDVESDPMTAVLIDGPTSGVVQLNDDGSFTYTTHSRFAGIDQFTYRASDGVNLSNIAIVTIEAGPQSEAILAGNEAYSVLQGETLTVSGNVIAESGLNDAAGIGSDDVAGSPYAIGESVHLRGATEPGWSGETWRVNVGGGDFGHDRARVVTSQVVEGDAAMFVDGASLGTWVHRRLPAAQSGRFSIEQHVRFTDLAGSFTSRPFGASATSEEIGPQWTAENGKILVRDGDGAGGGAMLDTGFRWQPGEWHQVSLDVDVAAQTYELSFDGEKYELPEPLGFRGSPTSIREIDYLSDKDAWIDRVRILSLDEDRLPSLLENDANAAGDLLQTILVDGPRHGDLTLNADGTFVYTPLTGLAASDAFTYRATNGVWVSNLATVTINGESSQPADLTGNGFVDFQDLTILLAAWNQNVSAAQGNLVNPGGSPVNFEDLTVLLAAWTGPGGAAAPQAAVVGSDRLQPVDQNRMNPVTTNVGPGFESDSELDAPRQAATYGSATGVASYRVRRAALRSRPTRRIGRLQAAAVDRAMEEQAMFERRERIFSRRTRRG